jgi:hypothetical protein
MDLSFPIPVIGNVALSTLSGLIGQPFDWQASVALQTYSREADRYDGLAYKIDHNVMDSVEDIRSFWYTEQLCSFNSRIREIYRISSQTVADSTRGARSN